MWPLRQSKIEPKSAINFAGEIDVELQNEKSFFWRIHLQNKIIGVISAQKTKAQLRSRGIWVHPNYRNNHLGQQLIKTVLDKAVELGLVSVWSMPRMSALAFYERLGFKKVKYIDGYEYGPHFIVELKTN